MSICTQSYNPSLDLTQLQHLLLTLFLMENKLELIVQHGAYHFSALQLKDSKLPFTLGWTSTNKRFIYLVSKRLVNLVHQPGESASVYCLSKCIPCVGCLLQVQRTD